MVTETQREREEDFVVNPTPQLQYRTELDTGILSFRARDEPYAVNYDAAGTVLI